MFRFFTIRLAQSIVLFFGVLVLVFFMVRLTGDPAALMLSREASIEQLEAFRIERGLDRPVPIQFADFMLSAVQGDLGSSFQFDIPNTELIFQRLPATLELATAALIVTLVIALPLGVLGGMYPDTWIDAIARLVGLAGQTIPSFWLALILIIAIAIPVEGIPTFGRDGINSLILPTIALSLAGTGQLVRLTRSAVLEVRNQNYIRTARSKGLSGRQVAWRHITPNAAIPLISVIGINYTYLLGGSVYIETVFSWPGLGGLLENAIQATDFPLVQAITIFIAFFAIVINLLTDLIYSLLDPRIRLS